MKRAAGAATFVVLASVASLASCGGRVDGVTGSSGSSGATATSSGVPSNPGPPPGSGRPGRPPPAPMTTAAVASAIAESYCKAFSSCCVGIGQPPIDVARCRELTSAAAQKQLDAAGASDVSAKEATVCVDAIHTRIAACGKEDVHWPGTELAVFAPSSIQAACATVFPSAQSSRAEPCAASTSCGGASTCAIDECTSAPALGAACPGGSCLDSAVCAAGSCVAPSSADVGASCMINDDCRLGLVCATGACAPSHDHPGLATQRSSPYRIGSDTCRAFTYL